MAVDRYSVPAYLDDEERDKLKAIAAHWGCSLSSAIKRLIREKEVLTNGS